MERYPIDMKTPKLIPNKIDEKHIILNKIYLCKYNGDYAVGGFYVDWKGLVFQAFGRDTVLNKEDKLWEGIWEIKEL